MRVYNYFPGWLTACLLLLVSGCSKPGADCFTSTGPVVKEERMLPSFDSVSLSDNISLYITYDSTATGQVVVEGGRNLIPGIVTEVVNHQLNIYNTNWCNWVRSYTNPLNVYIRTSHLSKIEYNASGDLISTDTLKFDTLKVEVWGGCGSIRLKLNTFQGYFVEHLGTADFDLRGRCAILNLYAGQYGPFNCAELVSNYCYVTTIASNDCRVNVHSVLEVSIGNIGNVYYTGDPDSISWVITGSGKLIRF
jgi:hypothetical protein